MQKPAASGFSGTIPGILLSKKMDGPSLLDDEEAWPQRQSVEQNGGSSSQTPEVVVHLLS